MRNNIRDQIEVIINSCLVAIIFTLGGIYLQRQGANDPDFFWHLKAGEWIAKNKALPVIDTFSYTAYGRKWIAHEWLTELIFYKAYDWFDLKGIWLIGLLLTAIVLLMTVKTLKIREAKNPILIFSCLTTILLGTMPWLVFRPQLFTYAFTAATLYLLEAKKYKPLPLIALLWVNVHGGTMPIFYFLVGIYFAFEGKKALKLWPYLLGILVGVTINPRGLEMLSYPLTIVGDPLQMHIAEWHSPNFQESYTYCFTALLILGPFFLKKKWRDYIIYAVLAYISILYLRNIPLFIIITTPMIFANITLPIKTDFKINQAISLILFLTMAMLFPVPTLAKKEQTLRKFPVGAIPYLKLEENQRIYNDYGIGGYLVWHEVKVFIDGRADLYSPLGIFKESLAVDRGEFEEVFKKYNITMALINKKSFLAKLLSNHGWEKLWHDDNFVLLYKRRYF